MRGHAPSLAQRGVTLVELIIFIVVVSIGVAGVLIAFNTAVASSADPMLTKQALRLAESTLQEVLQKSYQNDALDAANTSATLGCTATTTPSCRANNPTDRPNYNDVDDFNGYSQTGVTTLDGAVTVTNLATYALSISVDKATATLGAIAAPDVKKITVTVTGRGQTLSLSGYRSNYGY